MQTIKNNPHYVWLSNLKSGPIAIFLVLSFAVYIILMILIYNKFIPEILNPLNEVLTPTMTDWISAGFNKIILWLSPWIFLFFIVCGTLARTAWNTRKLLDILDSIEEK